MLNKKGLIHSQEKSPFRYKKGPKFLIERKEITLSKIECITSNEKLKVQHRLIDIGDKIFNLKNYSDISKHKKEIEDNLLILFNLIKLKGYKIKLFEDGLNIYNFLDYYVELLRYYNIESNSKTLKEYISFFSNIDIYDSIESFNRKNKKESFFYKGINFNQFFIEQFCSKLVSGEYVSYFSCDINIANNFTRIRNNNLNGIILIIDKSKLLELNLDIFSEKSTELVNETELIKGKSLYIIDNIIPISCISGIIDNS